MKEVHVQTLPDDDRLQFVFYYYDENEEIEKTVRCKALKETLKGSFTFLLDFA